MSSYLGRLSAVWRGKWNEVSEASGSDCRQAALGCWRYLSRLAALLAWAGRQEGEQRGRRDWEHPAGCRSERYLGWYLGSAALSGGEWSWRLARRLEAGRLRGGSRMGGNGWKYETYAVQFLQNVQTHVQRQRDGELRRSTRLLATEGIAGRPRYHSRWDCIVAASVMPPWCHCKGLYHGGLSQVQETLPDPSC